MKQKIYYVEYEKWDINKYIFVFITWNFICFVYYFRLNYFELLGIMISCNIIFILLFIFFNFLFGRRYIIMR
jgi:hypothetical protein